MNTWAVTLAAVAVLFLIVVPAAGAYLFNPHRARGVKLAESEQVIEHVVEARLAHPEIVRTTRLDWHPYFLLPHIGVWSYAVCVFFGAKLTNNVAVLSTSARMTMATCFIVGASLVLGSALMGVKVGRWRIMRTVHDHVTSAVLGDDIVLPYRLSMCGQFAVSVSMAIYSYTSFKTTTGSLGGWLTGALALACGVLTPVMFIHVRRFALWDTTLISEAMTRLGIGECHGR